MNPQDKLNAIRRLIDEFTEANNDNRDPDPIYLIQDIEEILNRP